MYRSTDAAGSGDDPEPVFKNLRQILSLVGPERVTVRLPKIPGFTAETHLLAAERKLQEMGVTDIDHLVYEKDSESL